MGCVEEGRRVDDEGGKGRFSAVAQEKVGPFRSRASRSETAPAGGRKNRPVFERLRHGDIHIQF